MPNNYLCCFLGLIGFLAAQIELSFPGRPPNLYNTYTPLTKSAPNTIGFIEGVRHNYWVDRQAGFTIQDQSDLIKFLLAIDDDPKILPN